jgi:hypothetical protein
MIARKVLVPAIGVLALTYGVLSQYAAAAEEIVVDGSAAAARVTAEKENTRSSVKEYVKSLNEQAMKSTLDGLKGAMPSMIYLAASESRIRG